MGKYVVQETASGFHFNLQAGNGQVIGSSETYTSEAGCLGGIESVRKNAPIAALEDQTAGDSGVKCPKFELYRDKADEFRFRLKARNGEPILHSEGYSRKDGCLGGIESVRANADSPVEKQ